MAYLNETIKHLTELSEQIDCLLDMGLVPAVLMSDDKVVKNTDGKIIIVGMENDCILHLSTNYEIALTSIGIDDWGHYITPSHYFIKLNNVTMKKILPQIIS